MGILQLEPGTRVLDVGCGTGYLLYELAAAVGAGGEAAGVEPSAQMRQLAVQRTQSMSQCNVKDGDAYFLPVADESFDVVVFSQVLLYVPDVRRALLEATRVLRCGGRLLILDTDWGSLVVNTMQRELVQRLQAAFETSFEDAHLPPKLPGLLVQCGLALEEVTSIPMITSGMVEQEAPSFMGGWAFDKLPTKALASGIAREDVDAWLEEQQLLSDANAFFACVHRFVFVARKS